jgi:ribosome-associated protein
MMQPGRDPDSEFDSDHNSAEDPNTPKSIDSSIDSSMDGTMDEGMDEADLIAFEQDEPNDGEFSSKSAKKREAERLRKMGKELTMLNVEQLKKLALHENLLKALLDYRRFKSHGAKRRQLLLIGGILRKIDVREVEAKLAVLNGEAASARYELHQLELWRDRLVTDTQALTQYLDEYTATDRQQLRQMVQKAQRATKMGKDLETPQAKAAARALFRFLRDSNTNNSQNNN